MPDSQVIYVTLAFRGFTDSGDSAMEVLRGLTKVLSQPKISPTGLTLLLKDPVVCLNENRSLGNVYGHEDMIFFVYNSKYLVISVVLLLLFAFCRAANAKRPSYPLEGKISCPATGYFHMAQVGDRWWFCAPDGRGDFIRATALTTDGSSGASGHGFRHYDKVCLLPNGSSVCQDVTNAAWDSNAGIGDVIMRGSSPAYSVRNSGDAIIIGSSVFPPEFVQFQNARMGVDGTVTWYFYSRASRDCRGKPPCWAPLNGNGKPAAVDTPNPSGSYYFDTSGNVGTIDRPVLNTGFIGNAGSSSGVDRMELWNTHPSCRTTGTSCLWPAGFTAQTLHGVSAIGDATPRYWIKGVVGTAFSIPPLIAQIYESRDTGDMLSAKYGGQSYTPYIKWFNNDIPKLISYGINATGQGSNRYWQILFGKATGDGGVALAPNATVPTELSWDTSDLIMRDKSSFNPPLVLNGSPVKNMMSNVSSTFCGGYEGRTPDAFDPQYTDALKNSVRFFTGQGSWAGNGNSLPDASRVFAILTEEADDLFLIGAKYHQHLGALVLMSNPYMAQDPQSRVTYSDPVFYSKTLGLRDFLANEYGCSGSADLANSNFCGAAAAANALAALNRAWGTHYTTWNTSSGSLSNGTNAYAKGTGFLDENGSHIVTSCRFVDYNHSGWTKNAAVRADLDAFVYRWSRLYAQSMRTAVDAVLSTPAVKPPIFTPLYTGPDQTYRAIAPYTDGFWTNPGESQGGTTYSFDPTQSGKDLARIAADMNKPIIVADYATSSGDIQGAIYCTIGAVAYNASAGTTTITANRCPYVLPVAVTLGFPDATRSTACPSSYPVPASVDWRQSAGTQFLLAGNFTSCLEVGNHLQSLCGLPGNCPADFPTWTAAANAEIARLNAMLNAANSAHVRPVVGTEWWDAFPEDLIGSSFGSAFGFLTYNDNLFDGTTDVNGIAKDTNGYPVGGEEPNTRAANRFLGPNGLATYLREIYFILR